MALIGGFDETGWIFLICRITSNGCRERVIRWKRWRVRLTLRRFVQFWTLRSIVRMVPGAGVRPMIRWRCSRF